MRLENLEARVAMSGAGVPAEVDPSEGPSPPADIEVAGLPAPEDLAVPVMLTIDPAGPLGPDESIDPAILMSMTGTPDEPVSGPVDGGPLPTDVPLMVQSGMAVDPTAPTLRPIDGAEILPVMATADPDLMVTTGAVDGTIDRAPRSLMIPLSARVDGPIEPSATSVRPLIFDPSVTEIPNDSEVRILSSGEGQTLRAARARPLVGVVRGDYHRDASQVPIDGGDAYRLDGEGRFGPIGSVTLSGSLTRDGFVTPGRGDLRGDVILSDGRGSISLRLEGSSLGLAAGRPVRLDASILDGTGPYRGLRGLGPALLRLGPNGFGLSLNLAPPRR